MIINLIRLEVNKIASNLYQDFLDEEIVSIFNKETLTYLSSAYTTRGNTVREGFEMSSKRKADLANLVVEDYIDRVFDTNVQNKKRFILPSNFMFYLNSISEVYSNSCGDINTTNNTYSSNYAFIEFKPGEVPDFSTFRLKTVTNTDLVTPISPENYIVPDNIEEFGKSLIGLPIVLGYKLYWEIVKSAGESSLSNNDKFYPNTLIIERTTGSLPNIKYSWDATEYTTITFSLLSATNKTGASGGTYTYPSNKEMQQGEIKTALKSNFNSPIAEEPIITFNDHYISVYTTSDFIIEKVYMTYFRKPKKISVVLQQDCELPEHVIGEIIARCVTHIKAVSESQTYNLAQAEENKNRL